MRKILVFRGGALGDFIVTLPALTLLRQRWPEARIELIGNATAASLARNRGLLDAVHSQHEARWGALFAEGPMPTDLTEWFGSFDLVLNYWPDPDADLQRRFPLRDGQTFLTWPAMPAQNPAARHYCEPLRTLGLEPIEYWTPLSPLAFHIGKDVPRRVAIHPGSGSPTKNWPAERWRELIDGLTEPLLLILGEAESETWSRTKFAKPNVEVAANPDLEMLVSRLAASACFLGHDSGISHLAAACRVPCVLLFGPTNPQMWAPPAPHVRVIQHGSALAAIPVAEVRATLQDSLKSSAER